MVSLVRTPAIPYVLALLVVGAATVATRVVWHLAPEQYGVAVILVPLFLVAVAVSARVGGVGPGLAATIASLLAMGGLVLLLDHNGRFTWSDMVRILGALPLGLIIGVLYAGKARAEQALRERDMRLLMISHQIPGGVWSTDAGLRVTSGFGTQSSLLHGPLGSTLYDHFEAAENEAIAAHRRALRGEPGNYELQWAGRTFQCYVEPLRTQEGEVIGVVGVATDMTERKRAEEEVGRAKQQLEAANHAKDRFLATLSHELRTPLTPVLALAQSLEARESLPEWVRDQMETIRRNVELEARLIDDLLDLTRIARGKLQLSVQDVDAHDLVRNAVEICAGDAVQKRVKICLDLSAGRSFVRADAARLQQVFWNLIKNAIKFTPEGGRITVASAGGVDGRVRFEVADTGIGIAPDVLPRIFDAFEQGDASITQQFGGLGLGLAITKALVDAHGGRIEAASDGPGCGSRFAVEMANVEVREPAPVHAPAGQASAAEASLTILLVEDHADTIKVVKHLLSESGHRVQTATTLAAALERLEAQAVDLLISDIGLPDGSGLELMRTVRERHGVRGIALSGFGTEEDVRRSLQAGFAVHLTKPVPISTLRQAIAEVATSRA